MNKNEVMKEIAKTLNEFDKTDEKIVHDTIDMLCAKGVGNGCYQDYGALTLIVQVLILAERYVGAEE